MKSRAIIWIIALLVLAVGGYWLGQWSARAIQAQRLSELERENAELRSTLDGMKAAVATPPPAVEPKEPVTTQPQMPPRQRPFEENQVIVSLQERLATSQAAAAERDARITDLEREIAALREETKRFAETRSDWNARAASSKAQLEQLQADLKSRGDELSEARNENRRLRDQMSEAGRQRTNGQRTLADLQDVYRRRETHLTNLLSRYKEINQQYRAFINVLENRVASESPAGVPGGPELTRIQNTLSLVEEDMRQLNHLNAQARRLQKQLESK